MQISYVISVSNILEIVAVVIGMFAIYTRLSRYVRSFDSAIPDINALKKSLNEDVASIKASMDAFQNSITTQMSMITTSYSNIDAKVSRLDDKYVRKDVHDAKMELINERLKPLATFEKIVAQHLAPFEDFSATKKRGRKT